MTRLAGTVAVVTGASRGIGRAVAEVLEESGARVAWLARFRSGPPPSERAGRCVVPCDVTVPAEVDAAADAVGRQLGPPDVLVVSHGAFVFRPVAETTPSAFREQVEVNLVAVFSVVRAFVAALAARHGRVITIGSVADHEGYPGNAAYAAAKFGVRGLHEVIASEYAGAVRATLISPGATDTTLWDPVDPDRRPDLPDRAAMLRPADVAEAVLFAVTRPPAVWVDRISIRSAS